MGSIYGLTSCGAIGQDLVLLFGTGFCGAFTTFSTYSVDVFKYLQANLIGYAFLLIFLSNILSISAAAIGWAIVTNLISPSQEDNVSSSNRVNSSSSGSFSSISSVSSNNSGYD